MPRRNSDEKRMRLNKILIGMFIIVLMVMSVFAIVADTMTGNTFTDYGVRLQVRDTIPYYTAKINGQQYEFYHTPSEAYTLPMDESVPQLLADAGYIIVSFDPEEEINTVQVIDLLRYEFDEFYEQPVLFAAQTENNYGLPVYTCENATIQTPVVSVTSDSLVNEIVREGDCVIISGEAFGLLRARDKIWYTTLEVYS